MYKFEKLHRCYLPKRSDPVLDPDLDRQAPDVYPDWQATAEDSTGFGSATMIIIHFLLCASYSLLSKNG
jgi:hypothetical protein